MMASVWELIMTLKARSGVCDAPPSANQSYANKKNGGRMTTIKYADWQKLAGLQLKRPQYPIKSPVQICIYVGKCNQARDLDNFAKPTIDLLKKIGWIENDNLLHVEKINLRKDFGMTPEGKIYIKVQCFPSDD
jgi:Holliday junction resolvase RusA-like endonuclease